MAEDLDPLTTRDPAMSHRGILLIMAALIAAGSIAGFAFKGTAFGVGVAFGGILAYANYFWLERSTRAIFDQNAMATTGILAAKYILRYVAISLVVWGVYATGVLPVVAVICGLAAFALAVVVQGLQSIFTGSN